MVQDGTLEIYIGGDEKTKSHFDADRFGFFDLIDEVKQLGYTKWSRVAFKVPRSMQMVDIKDDKDVMEMLSYLAWRISVLHVYVIGGEQQVSQGQGSIGGEAHVDGSVGGETHVQGEYVDDEVDDTEVEYDGGMRIILKLVMS